MINYYKLPIALKTDVANMYKKIREIVAVRNDTIRIEKDADLVLSLRGNGGNSIFYFIISEPKLNTSSGNNITYKIDYAPKSSVNIAPTRNETVGDSVFKFLNNWLSILIQNNNINIHPHDNITDQYEDEFDGWFEIAEEDATTKPFDTPRQILITSVINKSILQLKEAGFEDEEIIKEATELKKDISKLTMKQAFDSIKRLYAKLKIKGGMESVKLVYDVCKKEVIKMGFHLGTKELGEKLLTLIENYS